MPAAAMCENGAVRRFLFPVCLLAAVLAGFAWYRTAPRRTPAGQPELRTVTASPGGLDGLREAVNSAQDRDRLVLLLSPT